MTALARTVAMLTGAPEGGIRRLAGGDLSEVLSFERPDGRHGVAKRGAAVATEAAMLRALGGAGVPVPEVQGEHGGVLLLGHVGNDGVFNARAWSDIGAQLRRLHDHLGPGYGWPVDYALGTVTLHNQPADDWPGFWAERRLIATAAVLDRPWRERVDAVVRCLRDLLPASPPPALLHGDLWTGNILVADGRLAALIDPACCHGHAEVDLAMLELFDTPPADFWAGYGPADPGRDERLPAYQLFPALVHLRLFGASYAGLVDRLLTALRC